jgi:alpha-amylase
VGVLLQGFFFAPNAAKGVPSPLDGDQTVPFWWNHLAAQAHTLAAAGFSAVWLPPPLKGASGGASSGYDPFDDYDIGSKNQKGTVPTRYGTREQLARCVAMLRANGLDVYLDLVENHRDGDDGHFNFRYVDAFGRPGKGRFPKLPENFHPHVPEDPGVFDDRFSFGRDLAPINGRPKNYVFDGLIDAGDWLVRALDVQGFRIDDVKGVSTEFLGPFLDRKAMNGKFAVGEFFDGNIGLIQSWINGVQRRASAFDFPLRFAVQRMCNNPGAFDMSQLDHAGLAGVDPFGSVTFVENHDTDRNFPIVRNKMLAYAYILTVEGYPCVFYRDYSTDPHCFGLKPHIDRLIWIHEHLASGATIQRWKDAGVFAFERVGGDRLLVALNKDANAPRTITIDTGFPGHTPLQDFAGHASAVAADGASGVTLTIPKNENGLGYVCYSRPRAISPFAVGRHAVEQHYEAAADLDIAPAQDGGRTQVCRVFAEVGTRITCRIAGLDKSKWTSGTALEIAVEDPNGAPAATTTIDRATSDGSALRLDTHHKGFHTFFCSAKSAPPPDQLIGFRLVIAYQAPQHP